MANSFIDIKVTGTASYSFPFPYLSEDHIKVYVGESLQALGTHYTFTDTYTIQFTAGNIPADTEQYIRILRDTSTPSRLVSYSNTGLDADDLNLNADQVFYMAQEAVDTIEIIEGIDVAGLLDKTTERYDRSDFLGSDSYLTIGDRALFSPSLHGGSISSIVQVFLNGVLLKPTTVALDFSTGDYDLNATSGLSISPSPAASDEISVVKTSAIPQETFDEVSALADSAALVTAVAQGGKSVKETFTATAGQTVINLINTYVQNINNVSVYVNGVRQSAYDETTTSSITLVNPLSLGDEIVVIINEYAVNQFGQDEPVLLFISGQSNAVGTNNGGANPASSRVKTWDAVTSSWGGSDYTGLPWTRSTPDGNGGNNNFGLAAAHYIADKTGKDVYIVFDAVSGRSIQEWMGSGVSSTRYASLKAKIEDALATDEMTSIGKTQVDFGIWAQGEEDYKVAFQDHLDDLSTLDAQLRAESWMSDYTPIFTMGMAPLHDRYQVSAALRNFSNKTNGKWRYLSTRSLRVEGVTDYTHWLGPDLYSGGYDIIGPAFVNNERYSNEDNDGLFWNRGGGNADVSDGTVISSFNSLVNWNSRTGGDLSESFDGDGSKVTFTLDYRGTTISDVTVAGVSTTGYSTSTGTDGTVSITFDSAPPSGTDNVIVAYGAAITGPAATDSISYGYACHADGNQTFAGGYKCATNNTANYTLLWGRDLYAGSQGDFGAAHGFQNTLNQFYQFAAGRGHEVADQGGCAVGTFSEYTTAEADPVILQVGIGSSNAARDNGFAVRESGIIEMKNLSTYSDDTTAGAGGLTQGQVYQTAAGELRIKL